MSSVGCCGLLSPVTVAVVVGLVGLALKLPEVWPSVFGVIPVAFILAAGNRLSLRKVLHRSRRNGACLHEVLAVGIKDAVVNLLARTRQAPHNGWVVTGACTPSGGGTDGGGSILGYSRDAQRKLLVKPGMTGLWHISGRSGLSGKESVRLDLRYVQNWSLA